MYEVKTLEELIEGVQRAACRAQENFNKAKTGTKNKTYNAGELAAYRDVLDMLAAFKDSPAPVSVEDEFPKAYKVEAFFNRRVGGMVSRSESLRFNNRDAAEEVYTELEGNPDRPTLELWTEQLLRQN
jgi:hypothetical protein